jgi:16S rRNA G966 N2-methylase RsmD
LQADILFLDPPYASDLAEITLAALAERPLLAAHGVLVWQHMARRAIPHMVLERPLWKRRRYGTTQLSLYAAFATPTGLDGSKGQGDAEDLEVR